MSKYPWDILGIEPTRDEPTIRRAYARMLRRYRPDEDPEGFANLVRAREQALQRCLDDQDDVLVVDDDVDEVSVNETETAVSPGFLLNEFGGEAETTVPPEQSRTNTSQGFSSRNIEATVAPAETNRFDAQAQAAAFAATMNRLRELIRSVDRNHPGPIWDAGKWCAALAGMSELGFEHRRLLREFIVREALPTLPELQSVSGAMKVMREERGPGPVVAVWEDEFSIVQDQSTLARLCGAQAMLRYLAWFALAERARPLHKRSDAERHVIERLASLLPPGRQQKWEDTLPKEAWALQRWQELFDLIRQMESVEYARCRVFLADRLMIWLPVAPADTLSNLSAGSGPAAVVEAIEREFNLLNQQGAAPKDLANPLMYGPAFADPGDAARYKDWLDYVRRLRELEQRLARGEGAYRDQNGIPIIPADDIALGALSDASAIELAEAQRSGRWRLNLDADPFFLTAGFVASRVSPLLATVMVGIEVAVIPLTLMSAAVVSGVYLGAIIFTLLIACRVSLACMLPRLSAAAAVRRVRRADRAGAVARERRRRMVTIGRFGRAWGNFVGAIEVPLFVVIAAAMVPSSPPRYPTTASEWIQRGGASASNPERAIEAFTRVIDIDPNSLRAYFGRGQAYADDHRPDKAIEDFNHALALNSRDTAILFQRARAYDARGEPDNAIADYRAAIEINPMDSTSYNNRGILYRDMGTEPRLCNGSERPWQRARIPSSNIAVPLLN